MSACAERFRFARRPGAWLWVALALGAGARAFLVVASQGTHDVPIWESHAGWTREYGLVGYYERSDVFNHPPFIGWMHSLVWLFSKLWAIPFRIPLRAPFALLDLASGFVLIRLFAASPWRYALAAAYWLHPLAILYSGFHGNTDPAVAFFMLLAVWAAAGGHAAAAGAAIGLGLWIKLPVLLAAPAIFFALRGARARATFAGVALGVGVATYLPVLVEAPELLYRRVIAYPGRSMATPGGTPIWGIWSVLRVTGAPPGTWRAALQPLADWHLAGNRLVCWLPLIALAWLRRGEATARGLGTTVCGGLMIFHGFTNNLWAWQYLAWAVPFWLFPGAGFAALATLLVGGYVYAVYAYLCGSLLLLGEWRFNAVPDWPELLVLWRDAAVLFCFAAGWAFLAGAARAEWRRRGAA